MHSFNRRSFLKTSGMGLLPSLLPVSVLANSSSQLAAPSSGMVKFYGDGEMFEPGEYLNELQKFQQASPIGRDRYGAGGAVEALEKRIAEITGKEKAIYMPSGTMANQLAISVLSGNSTKIFVQDTSHIYRDEADAAQSVYNKRLMPLAMGETYFTADLLQKVIENLKEEEVFSSGIGAVAIENPVRRTDGRTVPLEEIKKISAYCKNMQLKLHLDGARIFIASGWTGIPVKEYAQYFDTVYISLYKYFGASGGAVLAGPKEIIDQMPHLVKIHGGSMYGNWTNAAMALGRLEGFEARLKASITAANTLFSSLNKVPGIQVKPLDSGTNIYNLQFGKTVDGRKAGAKLNTDFNIRFPRPNEQNHTLITVNETILNQPVETILDAFKKSIQA